MIRRRDLLGLASLAGAAVATSALAGQMRASMAPAPGGATPRLQDLPRFLDGRERHQPDAQMVDPVEIDPAFAQAIAIYDTILAASYVRAGEPDLMLNLAYRRSVSQEDKFHWPQVCYATQGYDVTRLPDAPVQAGPRIGSPASTLPFGRFVARSSQRTELVAYTVLVGKKAIATPSQLRQLLFTMALGLKVPDALLLRLSSALPDSGRGGPDAKDWGPAWAMQAQFLQTLGTTGGPSVAGRMTDAATFPA